MAAASARAARGRDRQKAKGISGCLRPSQVAAGAAQALMAAQELGREGTLGNGRERRRMTFAVRRRDP
ncbi:hypothetical protein MRA01_51240 [Methylobacterium radiotolerans]|nr:hypothetical protein MRA01_51240 [Methylobacterium radiotolerans]